MTIIHFLCVTCAQLAACLLRGFGIDVESEGIWIAAENGKFAYMVIPECCGIKSMLVLAGLALYYGFLELKKPTHAAWLAVWSLPVAFGANLLRILSVAAAAHSRTLGAVAARRGRGVFWTA